jgi:hypothetical protein
MTPYEGMLEDMLLILTVLFRNLHDLVSCIRFSDSLFLFQIVNRCFHYWPLLIGTALFAPISQNFPGSFKTGSTEDGRWLSQPSFGHTEALLEPNCIGLKTSRFLYISNLQNSFTKLSIKSLTKLRMESVEAAVSRTRWIRKTISESLKGGGMEAAPGGFRKAE